MTGSDDKGSNSAFFESILEAGRKKKISRREFMQIALAAGVTLSSASAMWSSRVLAATPKKGGNFRIGMHDGNTSDTMDPGTYESIHMICLAHTHRSYLTQINPDNSLGPDMASAWEANPQATRWTFDLAKGASFHSGKKFTAKDAIASLNHHRGEKTTSAAKPLLSDVTDIKADGDHRIIIELSQGFADLPWIMTDYHLVMLPANEDGTIDWRSEDGAGPYKIEHHEAGVRTELVRHEGWHREGAYFDSVEYTVLNDPNARQTALVTGEVDAVSSTDFKTLSMLKRHPKVKVLDVPSAAAITLPMHCDVAPFNDVNVRNALKLSINRQEIVDKILFGTGTVANDFHLSPAMPYWPDDIPQREYDPDKAKSLLKKAGKEKLSVNLSATDGVFPGAVDMCVLYSEHAKAAGIDITVVREPTDGYWSNVWLKKPWVFVRWGARPTPDNMFTLAYKADAAWNESHWENERFNELLLKAKAELDDQKRAEMYREMCLLARNDGGTVIPTFLNHVYATRDNVMHGENLAPSWELDGGRAAHRWWFA